ncbi:aminotransferase class V-fold PLP-dependent enzyme, partial [bacterium]|nr:aminotransferase class V-fold PLP-dependent enzyme [bacterium]
VFVNRYTISKQFPEREEAGTPNICGAIGLGASLYALSKIGMDFISEEECKLIEYALSQLKTVKDLIIYGETDCQQCKRTGSISFNFKTLDHALVAAVLNDYFNIAVRNECFCAHPYVREMITQSLSEDETLSDDDLEKLAELHRGMVRASFGIYSTQEDVDLLVTALQNISAKKEYFQGQYIRQPDGSYSHKTFKFVPASVFSIQNTADSILREDG